MGDDPDIQPLAVEFDLLGQQACDELHGLAGLGRITPGDATALAEGTGFSLDENRWSRALSIAAQNRQPGTVALLAAVGMQTNDWRAVPPAYLYHILAALRAVGREPEARMIAAEALTRT